jgi:hypothetical protein
VNNLSFYDSISTKKCFLLFLENTLAQLVIAKNSNIDLIKKYEEKKLEEHKYLILNIKITDHISFII